MLRHKQVVLSWQVADDEESWLQLTAQKPFCQTADVVHGPRNQRRCRRHWHLRDTVLGLVLVLLLGVTVESGFRLYRIAQAGVAVLETELQEAVRVESFETANSVEASEVTLAALHSFHIHGDVAAVEIVIEDPTGFQPYRETRFYRHVDGGWQPTASDLRFWGPPQQLESEFILFRYRKRDARAVVAAAPKLDAFYTQLHQVLGRPLPNPDSKPTILVFASYDAQWGDLSPARPDTIVIPSPALQRIPADMSNAEVIELAARMSLTYRLLPRKSAGWLDASARPDER